MAVKRRKRVAPSAIEPEGRDSTAELLEINAPGPDPVVSGASAREVLAEKLAETAPDEPRDFGPGGLGKPSNDPEGIPGGRPEEKKHKGGPGRPKGSRNRDPKSGKPKPRYEDLEAEVKRLKSELNSRDPEARLRQEEEERDAEEGFGFLCNAVFGIIAHRKGDHWKLSKEEESRLGRNAAKAFGPWLPSMGNYLPWIFLFGSLYDSIDSRVMIDVRKASEEKARTEGLEVGPGVTVHTKP